MAESMTTPTKISARNPVRRVCGGSHESRYMLWIFTKAGSSKDLCSKVYKSCGIKITEDDTRLAVLCRSCVAFVDKMDQFIRGGGGGGGLYSESSISRQYAVLYKLRIFDSVKRCFQLSPTSHQPSKRPLVLKEMPTESFDVAGRPSQLLAHAKMPLFPISFFPVLGRLYSGRFIFFE